jgi:hypothetical protein
MLQGGKLTRDGKLLRLRLTADDITDGRGLVVTCGSSYLRRLAAAAAGG